jgi:hypothetical protein
MFAGVSATGAGTGKTFRLFSIGSYFYGIYTIITLILSPPVIGGRFLQINDIGHIGILTLN